MPTAFNIFAMPLLAKAIRATNVSSKDLPAGYEFNPRELFKASEQGIWLDPSDFSTMFQDAAGTTPVTAVGQPVGLALDKRLGLALGSERLTNGDFASGATGWTVTGNDATHIATFSGGTLRYQSDTTTPALTISQASALTIGKWYEITTVVSGYASGSIKSDTVSPNVLASGLGTTRVKALATSTSFNFLRNVANVDMTIDSISIKELPGNHAYQTTAASRPTLQQDSNGLYYLSFDGTDDGMLTPSINFTGTDKTTVWAGVRKNSDAARGIVCEFTGGGTAGGFSINAPTAALNGYLWQALGSTAVGGALVSGYAAPVSNVLCGTADIAADANVLRINAVQVATNTSDLGTGNFANAALYIGRRNNASLPFSGRIYQLIVRGAASNAGQIAAGEAWCNGKTRAY